MTDTGLVVSIALMIAVPMAVFARSWHDPSGMTVLDIGLWPLVIGLLAGRATTLLIDDPSALTSIADFFIIRSGVEFWPGVAAGLIALAVSATRDNVRFVERAAFVAAPALLSWSVFELSCVLRDGCPGPISAIGLRPDGLATKMFPIGIVVGVVGTVSALVVGRFSSRVAPPSVVGLAVLLIAAIRGVASWFLPHIGDGITRQHAASITVAIGTAGFLLLRVTMHKRVQTRLP
jgi:hypothetical protein